MIFDTQTKSFLFSIVVNPSCYTWTLICMDLRNQVSALPIIDWLILRLCFSFPSYCIAYCFFLSLLCPFYHFETTLCIKFHVDYKTRIFPHCIPSDSLTQRHRLWTVESILNIQLLRITTLIVVEWHQFSKWMASILKIVMCVHIHYCCVKLFDHILERFQNGPSRLSVWTKFLTPLSSSIMVKQNSAKPFLNPWISFRDMPSKKVRWNAVIPNTCSDACSQCSDLKFFEWLEFGWSLSFGVQNFRFELFPLTIDRAIKGSSVILQVTTLPYNYLPFSSFT